MKQSELIQLIAKDTNLRYDAVRKVLRKLTKYMCVALEQGEPLRIGVGTFQLKERGPKPVQDFRKGERYMMGPTNKLIFTPSSYVKSTVKKADITLQTEYEARQTANAKKKDRKIPRIFHTIHTKRRRCDCTSLY